MRIFRNPGSFAVFMAAMAFALAVEAGSTTALLPSGASHAWWAQLQPRIAGQEYNVAQQDARTLPHPARGLATEADWTTDGEGVNDFYGFSLATAGDVNGDGYSDVIVGALGYSSDAGRVYVYYGSASGLSLLSGWTAESGQSGARMGCSVSTAGDVNGDGYSDIIVGAYNYDRGETNEGRVFVWLGSAAGLGENGTPANADWTAESNQAASCFGYSVSTAGDINGDGYSDIIAGAYRYSAGQLREGAAFVWLGSAAGLGENGTPANADWIGQADQDDAHLGVAVSTAGDVNGDGYSDIIAGADSYDGGFADEGAALVWLGQNPASATAAPRSTRTGWPPVIRQTRISAARCPRRAMSMATATPTCLSERVLTTSWEAMKGAHSHGSVPPRAWVWTAPRPMPTGERRVTATWRSSARPWGQRAT